jgi:O-succinylbenzoic acid--CoA ligase
MIYGFMLLFSPHSLEYPQPTSDFQSKVFDFCKLWSNGQAAFQFMTSGSTGEPKPILLTREAMIASANTTGEWLKLEPNDVALLCLPVDYIAGAMVVVRAMILKLQICMVEPSLNPLLNLKPISIQLASFVPNQWHAMLQEKIDFDAYFSKAKAVLLGGADISPWILSQTSSLNFPVYLTYGMTETVSHVAFRSITAPQTTCFSLLPNIDFSTNEQSCAKFKGKITAESWVQTNDLVEQIDSKHFNLLGRADRVINSAGRKIHAEKIEKEIGRLLHDRLFFIGSIPDPSLGQKAILFIEGHEQIDENMLNLSHFPSLSSWELPKQVVYLSTFERTSSGKMDQQKSVDLYLKSQK